MTTYCPWKGDASYYNVLIGGEYSCYEILHVQCDETVSVEDWVSKVLVGDGLTGGIVDKKIRDAAWYYAHPYDAAIKIKNHIAFCGFLFFACTVSN